MAVAIHCRLIFLFARSNADRESNADADGSKNVQLPWKSESKSDVADRKGFTHKIIPHDSFTCSFVPKNTKHTIEIRQNAAYFSIVLSVQICMFLRSFVILWHFLFMKRDINTLTLPQNGEDRDSESLKFQNFPVDPTTGTLPSALLKIPGSAPAYQLLHFYSKAGNKY